MGYTIGQAAKRCGLTAHTLRYYDKEGLLFFVNRGTNGQRVFKEEDFDWLSVITCLKKLGCPIKEIRKYMEWCQDGDDELANRLGIIQKQKELLKIRMKELQEYMDEIDFKIWYYNDAIASGTAAELRPGHCHNKRVEYNELFHKNICEEG